MVKFKKSTLVPDDAATDAAVVEGTPAPVVELQPDPEPATVSEAQPPKARAYAAVLAWLPLMTNAELHALRMNDVRRELQRRRGVDIIRPASTSHTPIDSIPGEKL